MRAPEQPDRVWLQSNSWRSCAYLMIVIPCGIIGLLLLIGIGLAFQKGDPRYVLYPFLPSDPIQRIELRNETPEEIDYYPHANRALEPVRLGPGETHARPEHEGGIRFLVVWVRDGRSYEGRVSLETLRQSEGVIKITEEMYQSAR